MNVMDWIAVGVFLLVLTAWSISEKLGTLVKTAQGISEGLGELQEVVANVETQISDLRASVEGTQNAPGPLIV